MNQLNLVWLTCLAGSVALGACADNMLGEILCDEGDVRCAAPPAQTDAGGFVDDVGIRGSVTLEGGNESETVLPAAWVVDVPCGSACSNPQLELAPNGKLWLTSFEPNVQALSLVSADGVVEQTYTAQVGADLGAQLSVDGQLNPYIGPLVNEDDGAYVMHVRANTQGVKVLLDDFSPQGSGFLAATSEGLIQALRADHDATTVFQFDAGGKVVWRQENLHGKPALAFSEQDFAALDRGAALLGGTTAVLLPMRGAAGTNLAGDHWGLTALDANGAVTWSVHFKFAVPGLLVTPRPDGGVIVGSRFADQSGKLQFLALKPDGSYQFVWDVQAAVAGSYFRDLRLMAMGTDSYGDVYAVIDEYEAYEVYDAYGGIWGLCRMSLTSIESITSNGFVAACAPLEIVDPLLHKLNAVVTDLVVPAPGVVIASISHPAQTTSKDRTEISLIRFDVPPAGAVEAWGRNGSSGSVP